MAEQSPNQAAPTKVRSSTTNPEREFDDAQTDLKELLAPLRRRFKNLSELIEFAETIDIYDHAQVGVKIACLSDIRRQVQGLEWNVDDFWLGAENYTHGYVLSLAKPGTAVASMMSHFDNSIYRIVDRVLKDSDEYDKDWDVMRNVLETCYEEATQVGGSMRMEHYFEPHGCGFASEKLERCQQPCEVQAERAQLGEEWIGFWTVTDAVLLLLSLSHLGDN